MDIFYRTVFMEYLQGLLVPWPQFCCPTFHYRVLNIQFMDPILAMVQRIKGSVKTTIVAQVIKFVHVLTVIKLYVLNKDHRDDITWCVFLSEFTISKPSKVLKLSNSLDNYVTVVHVSNHL